ncbi:hypothetical protein COT94_03530 [Candidatus Falkowbacteria bacterium CG10_big_fil_rev_8_21_14_0_10_37_14]|uniref:General secretion pathway GspH domain-containing protein n=1 Tax=Candidatus Falkowbacteria bacterium CG10_big_fil_rev_8_21_14_0_10_37_14 TaxID=1974561 RepID=A0A2M6WT22_9BACT|nr:prepilin-type N-terminal cleavage/methylation domain-containing protein [Candidatus Falkowbacteria bacterium]PIT95891.1 MAG: hypothetical protein COT94_03530 [Candidatus Falkowbacteria bacterium CG10_big_fil_rev_8_21_14_0_10_37_14]
MKQNVILCGGSATKGFTLIELLITLTVASLVIATAWPLWGGLTGEAILREQGFRATQLIRKLEEAAAAGLGNSQHGIKLMNNQLILFRGSNYASRIIAYDQVLDMGVNGLAVSWQLTGSGSVDEVIFSKGTGVPSRSGQIVITDADNFKATIDINSIGLVEVSSAL